ncbi:MULTISPECIES: OadG-related small transporter subunit [unclassified Caproiciproducens]|uniref:OadG-related small transporter subunit n=1 Tax=Caproiciproducens sp. R2 TaxID=3435187 RepID=UPI0040341571
MMQLNAMAVLFKSLMGDVSGADIGKSFELMGKGMLGIFIVMILIYAVIVILSKTSGTNKDSK